MSEAGLKAAVEKMRAKGVNEAAITVFEHYYHQLEAGSSGLIPESSVKPLANPEQATDLHFDEDQAHEALARTAVIKLNGGLGTSMGLDKAKSLLPVREGNTFFDIICKQILAARKRYGVKLPLIFMNSFSTRTDTLAAAKAYPDLQVDGLPLDFMQNEEPKLLANTLEPASWLANPALEWCPPGHGDIYVALAASGILDQLIDAGYRYVMTSNSDNLGATPCPQIAAWFAASGAPYAPEVTKRTVTDLKGGHLVVRKSDDQLILRETAQISPEEMHYFTDAKRHPYTHTNNLWLNLKALRDRLAQTKGVLGMPLIANHKTVDPKDSSSPAVIQIETAMGAAVEVFEGSRAIAVPRSRFLPVKTTAELTLVRSDLYDLDEDYHLVKVSDEVPNIVLDSRYFKKIADFEQRFGKGVPSLKRAESLIVEGDWTFGADVSVVGKVRLEDAGEPKTVADGTVLE